MPLTCVPLYEGIEPSSLVAATLNLVEPRGIEPRSKACKAPVLPLYYDPKSEYKYTLNRKTCQSENSTIS